MQKNGEIRSENRRSRSRVLARILAEDLAHVQGGDDASRLDEIIFTGGGRRDTSESTKEGEIPMY